MGRHIVISTSVDLVRVATEGVVYISSDGNYSTLIQADGGSRILTVQLGQLETLIARQLETDGNVFIRIGKSLIINRNYIHLISQSSNLSFPTHGLSATLSQRQRMRCASLRN